MDDDDEQESNPEAPKDGVKIGVKYPEPGESIQYRLGEGHYIEDDSGARVVGPCKVTFTMPQYGTEFSDMEVTREDLTDEDAFQVFGEVLKVSIGSATEPHNREERVNVYVIEVKDLERNQLFKLVLPVAEVTKMMKWLNSAARKAQSKTEPKIVIAGPGQVPKHIPTKRVPFDDQHNGRQGNRRPRRR